MDFKLAQHSLRCLTQCCCTREDLWPVTMEDPESSLPLVGTQQNCTEGWSKIWVPAYPAQLEHPKVLHTGNTMGSRTGLGRQWWGRNAQGGLLPLCSQCHDASTWV